MQVTETLSDGLKRAYTVVVPVAKIEEKRTARLTELGKTLKLPGFRPGKVPMNVVRSRYSAAVMSEVLEGAVNDATKQVLNDRGLTPATQPKIDVVSLDDGKDLEFKVEFELMPEIQMPDFAGIELVRSKAEPAADVVDNALKDLATRSRSLVDTEAGYVAAKGDVTTIDFVGKIDGEAFQGGTAQGVQAEVAGPGFITGFTEQLEGMKAGEERTINVTFPEDYNAKELAGKAAAFDITMQKIQQPVVPAIDDELAKKLGLESLDKLREIVTGQIQNEYNQLSRMRLKRQLLDALAERAAFPAPEALLNAEFDAIWRRVDADMKAGNLDDEDKGKDEDTLKSEYRAIAERRVKLGLLLSEIGRVNNLSVSQEELLRAMRAEAMRYQGQEQQVMDFFRKNPQAIENLRAPIFEEKIVDFVVELAKVTDKSVSIEELTAEVEKA